MAACRDEHLGRYGDIEMVYKSDYWYRELEEEAVRSMLVGKWFAQMINRYGTVLPEYETKVWEDAGGKTRLGAVGWSVVDP
jgi:hypothetical protein